MATADADINSTNAARVLKMLCNHWRHKFKIVSHHDGHALIDLAERGVAEFTIRNDVLHTQARHPDPDALPGLLTAIQNHLQRFAKDETLIFEWH